MFAIDVVEQLAADLLIVVLFSQILRLLDSKGRRIRTFSLSPSSSPSEGEETDLQRGETERRA